MADTLDEYFEYEAEEFLVSLALLITEGRTFIVLQRSQVSHQQLSMNAATSWLRYDGPISFELLLP